MTNNSKKNTVLAVGGGLLLLLLFRKKSTKVTTVGVTTVTTGKPAITLDTLKPLQGLTAHPVIEPAVITITPVSNSNATKQSPAITYYVDPKESTGGIVIPGGGNTDETAPLDPYESSIINQHDYINTFLDDPTAGGNLSWQF